MPSLQHLPDDPFGFRLLSSTFVSHFLKGVGEEKPVSLSHLLGRPEALKAELTQPRAPKETARNGRTLGTDIVLEETFTALGSTEQG